MFKTTVLKTLILICFLLLTTKNSLAESMDALKIFYDTNQGTVLIKTYNEEGKQICMGTGFFISRDGKVATNYHIIDGAKKVVVKDYEKKEYELKNIVGFDMKKDLVIFRVDAKTPKVLTVGDSGKVVAGQQVCVNNTYSVVMGLVGVTDKKTYEGAVVGLKNSGELSSEIPTFLVQTALPLFQITASMPEDCSGGPLFNRSGEVVGVMTFGETTARNTRFAIPSQHLLVLLQSTGEPKQLEDLPKIPKPPTIMGLTFGMNKGTASTKFINALAKKIDEKEGLLVYKGSLAQVDIPDTTRLYFKVSKSDDPTREGEKRLYGIETFFNTSAVEPSASDLINRYENLKNILTKKYGHPSTNREFVDSYFDDPDIRLYGFLTGKAEYSSSWDTEQLRVFLAIGAEPNKAVDILKKVGSPAGKTKAEFLTNIRRAKDEFSMGNILFSLRYFYKPLMPETESRDISKDL
ncbi:MAG: serine protease [Candidatus Omnitrophota bacterium]